MNKTVCVTCGNEFDLESAAGTCPHCGAAFSANTDQSSNQELAAGTLLGGYEIIRTLGYGGMGIVYLAEQKSMQRQIALKVLNHSVTKDAAAVEQFLTEIRNTGQINHPHMVSAFDAGCENGVYYFAMQYITGDTWDNMIQHNGAMDEIKALEYTVQVASALEYVWTKHQIYHRDIKPGNIMINDEGKAVLMDLGIAQKISDWKGTEENIEGSPYYMSPEQIQGKPMSWTTDLYSLGATVYQLIVGEPPYDDETIDGILRKHCLEEFPEPETRKPGCKISPETVDLLKKMMAKEPEKRFASWKDFIKETEALIALLKDLEAHPEKRLLRDAVAMAEAKREKIRKKKARASKITFSVVGAIVLLAAIGYFLISFMNRKAAAVYLNQKGEGPALLAEAHEKFLLNPASLDELEKILKEAELAATSLGVSADDTNKILNQVEEIRKKAEQLHANYREFEKFSKEEFPIRSKQIHSTIKELEGMSTISLDDCTRLKDLISNLQAVTKLQAPQFSLHQKRLKEIQTAIEVMEKELNKGYDRLKKQNEAEAKRKNEENARREAAERQRVMQQKQAALAAEESKIRAEVERKAAAERKAEADRIARMHAAAAAAKKVKPKTVVKKLPPVVLSNKKNALVEVKKELVRIKNEFELAFALLDFKQAADIAIIPEIRELKLPTHDKVLNAEIAKLMKEYDANHHQAAIALKCWNQLNDLTRDNVFHGVSVRRTVSNRELKTAYLRIDKIQNGNVYFRESEAMPEKFVDLFMRDKENIAERLVRVKKFTLEESQIFYFRMGLYGLAYSVCPDAEQKKLEAKIKETVRIHWNLAKKRKDLQMRARMERDYKGNKILKSILR